MSKLPDNPGNVFKYCSKCIKSNQKFAFSKTNNKWYIRKFCEQCRAKNTKRWRRREQARQLRIRQLIKSRKLLTIHFLRQTVELNRLLNGGRVIKQRSGLPKGILRKIANLDAVDRSLDIRVIQDFLIHERDYLR